MRRRTGLTFGPRIRLGRPPSIQPPTGPNYDYGSNEGAHPPEPSYGSGRGVDAYNGSVAQQLPAASYLRPEHLEEEYMEAAKVAQKAQAALDASNDRIRHLTGLGPEKRFPAQHPPAPLLIPPRDDDPTTPLSGPRHPQRRLQTSIPLLIGGQRVHIPVQLGGEELTMDAAAEEQEQEMESELAPQPKANRFHLQPEARRRNLQPEAHRFHLQPQSQAENSLMSAIIEAQKAHALASVDAHERRNGIRLHVLKRPEQDEEQLAASSMRKESTARGSGGVFNTMLSAVRDTVHDLSHISTTRKSGKTVLSQTADAFTQEGRAEAWVWIVFFCFLLYVWVREMLRREDEVCGSKRRQQQQRHGREDTGYDSEDSYLSGGAVVRKRKRRRGGSKWKTVLLR